MPLTPAARRAIETLHEAWIARELAGRGAELAPFLADDAIMLPPDAPPVLGRAAVARLLATDGPPPAALDARIEGIWGEADTATKVARFAGRAADGTPFEGTHVWILSAAAASGPGTPPWRIRLLAWSFRG